MTASPRLTLAIAAALIVGTNAFVLAGVAYNRSGAPEATLRLSERELAVPYEWGIAKEKSSISLDLTWRVAPPASERRARYYEHGWGAARWLTSSKLTELGFKLPTSDATGAANAPEGRHKEREVYLVLEMDGVDYKHAVLAAQERLAREEAAVAKGERRNAAESAKSARAALDRELTSSSRLFVIDAGLDAQALRDRYADRSRFAVVAGRVRPTVSGEEGKRQVLGYVRALSVERINAPLELVPVFDALGPTRNHGRDAQPPRFEATVAYGRRLEPWLISASTLSAEND